MSGSEPVQPDAADAPDYRVELEVYHGPLDLLLYLIRREEIDVYDIPIARITGQYLEHVEVLRRIDPDAVSDFLVLAATLMEIKSRMLLPRPPAAEDDEEDLTDPRMELVRQLLEYKKFKDVARHLDAAAEVQALKHSRGPVVPPSDRSEVDLEDVQLWDLVDAFKRLLEQTGQREATHDVVFDDTPIALYATDLLDLLERAGGAQLFEAIFQGRSKVELIGLFLALLELLRQKRVQAVQEKPFGPISIRLLDATPIQVDEEHDYTARLPEADAREAPPDENDTPESSARWVETGNEGASENDAATQTPVAEPAVPDETQERAFGTDAEKETTGSSTLPNPEEAPESGSSGDDGLEEPPTCTGEQEDAR